jgi:hypothetical protein
MVMKNNLNGWYVASVMPPNTTVPPRGEVYQGWRPCIIWCTKTFGDMRPYDSPDRWRFVSEGVFEFREEQDCTLFLLKWS